MRITKAVLDRRWAICSMLAWALFAIMVTLDLSLKAASGVGTGDLQGFALGAQFRAAALAWAHPALALRAGFLLGFDYLFMPAYAAAMFYSGIVTREAFAPRPSRLRRLLTLLAAVPIAAGILDAIENCLELSLLLGNEPDSLARLAFTISNAKMMGVYVGLVLFAGAILALVQERQKRRQAQS